MSYLSVDELQKVLSTQIFHYAQDGKKAAGRALGTLVEIITFYALKSWGFEKSIAIERPLPEFANSSITHNVEFSLHPSSHVGKSKFESNDLPLTSSKISKQQAFEKIPELKSNLKSTALLSTNLVLRNSCTISDATESFYVAYLENYDGTIGSYSVEKLHKLPYAIFECKRVGVEDGQKKGPQTIEKAKQGAYVARTVSSLQKLRRTDGSLAGIIENKDGTFNHGEYYDLMAKIITGNLSEYLSNFILTIGVVSNHGNWFTSGNQNKELKVLAQAYDWLLFLTDKGLAQFIDELLLSPKKDLEPARDAFLASYKGVSGKNQFTKVQMAYDADQALQNYFKTNSNTIENWFNVISPAAKSLQDLRTELEELKAKNWTQIHK